LASLFGQGGYGLLDLDGVHTLSSLSSTVAEAWLNRLDLKRFPGGAVSLSALISSFKLLFL
jgi:hypothetical protein